ncbi:Uncharacterised protein [Mycobacteroides abscessus subsp. abscessus]|nr:Uncharacterised protein [Mycobacteroides abscessus subsp. abscessus]
MLRAVLLVVAVVDGEATALLAQHHPVHDLLAAVLLPRARCVKAVRLIPRTRSEQLRTHITQSVVQRHQSRHVKSGSDEVRRDVEVRQGVPITDGAQSTGRRKSAVRACLDTQYTEHELLQGVRSLLAGECQPCGHQGVGDFLNHLHVREPRVHQKRHVERRIVDEEFRNLVNGPAQ